MTVNRFLLPLVAAIWLAVLASRATASATAPVETPPAPPPAVEPAAATPSVQATASNGAAQAPAAGYVGAETCLTCHEGQKLDGTAHGHAIDARTPMAKQGCESCHGPGQKHVEAGGDKALILRMADMRADDVTATCTTCHNRGEHALWSGSQHDARNVACTSCHSVHSPKSANAQLIAADQAKLCATCHRDKVAKLDRSGHMPVREGKMTCTSCHNVHGSANVKLLRAGFSSAEACTSCHTEKRGPFLFEHAPVRESCVTCHDPHGSPNERMLVAKAPFLCQRCHSHTRHPGTLYDGKVTETSNRIASRSCATCHSQIHGSNHPSGHTFLR